MLTLIGPDADSLCSVEDADTWHTARGNVAEWLPLEMTRKEELLRKAYDYLRGEFASQWPAGVEFGIENGTVARGARAACALLALIAKDGELDPEVEPQVVESTVGPITDKFAKRTSERRIFPAVERLMSPHLVDLTPANPFSISLRRG